ncbi:hypothetical protein TNCV_3254261 [Trichonephila clavipes]|nr:hypothetical protein TNCV_3254261 [Trichonephila clavipes]
MARLICAMVISGSHTAYCLPFEFVSRNRQHRVDLYTTCLLFRYPDLKPIEHVWDDLVKDISEGIGPPRTPKKLSHDFRSHSGNLGNDRADQLAKEATCQDMNILMSVPLSHWKHVAWEITP